MSKRHNESFKLQAVEKVLTRSHGTTIEDISIGLGVGLSTIGRWVKESREQKIGTGHSKLMTKGNKPQDLSLQTRLNHIKNCAVLDEDGVSAYCRKNGIYPHHIQQWEQDFVAGDKKPSSIKKTDGKALKAELNTLKKEIKRKDKALAETAALLVLQKKVHEIWGNDEDS